MHARPPRARTTRTVVLALLALTPLLTAVTVVGTGTPAAASTAVTPRIDTGAEHTCVVVTDGTVRCWGRNQYGQLGTGQDGTALPSAPHPVTVAGLSGATAIATGEGHTCALLADTTVRCWGANSSGQLGDGTTTDQPSPVTVAGLGGVTAISAGGFHTCAVLADTTVRCWGANSFGQLGDGTTDDRLAPVAVTGLTGATAITVGQLHSCALLTDTTARCWGRNFSGQLGAGTSTDPGDGPTSLPLQMLDTGATQGTNVLSGITLLSTRGAHTCALTTAESGAVRCAGINTFRQIGDNTTTPALNPFDNVNAKASGGISIVAAGGTHTCALYRDGYARCWGNGTFGQLGDGNTVVNGVPALVALFEPIADVSAGGSHTCALMVDDSVRCWGRGAGGRLGDGEAVDRTRPVTVLASGTASTSPVPFSVRVAVPAVTGPAEPTVAVGCVPEAAGDAIVVGTEVTCTVTGGPADFAILWRVSVNPVIAEAGVTLDAEGRGTFSFTVPPSAEGRALLVELVDWTAPVAIGVVGASDAGSVGSMAGGPVPSRVPAGEGPWPGGAMLVVLVVLVGVLGASLAPTSRAAAARTQGR